MIDLDAGWRRCRLGDLVDVNPESLRSETDEDYEFFYLDLSSVSEGRVEWPENTIRFGEAPSRARRIVRQHDILLSTVRPNLRGHARLDHEVSNVVASTGFAVLRPKPTICAEYIYQWLFSPMAERQYARCLTGSNYPALSKTDVENLEIAIPEARDRQEKISDILRTWDKAAEQLEQRCRISRKLLGEVESKFFRKALQGSGPYTTVGELFEIENHAAPVSSLANLDSVDLYSLPAFDAGEGPEIVVGKSIGSDKTWVRGERILFSKLNPKFQRVWHVSPHPLRPSVCSTEFWVLRPRTKNICLDYAAHLLRSKVFLGDPRIAPASSTKSHQRVDKSFFLSVSLSIPTVEVQRNHATALNALHDEIRLLARQVKLIRTQKRGLMQKLLTGEWRVNVD